MEVYNTFHKNNHLQPLFDEVTFNNLHDWKFGWALLETINIAKDDEEEKILATRFSPGQKALYFIWYLDAQVTNGGFIQFFYNGYRKYLSPIIEGLKLIGDNEMVKLVEEADKEYLANKEEFIAAEQSDDLEDLYDDLSNFDTLDTVYYAKHNETMNLIEKFARQYPEDFVKFK